jgi:CHAT domain-containing protein
VDSLEMMEARTRDISARSVTDARWTIGDLTAALPPHAALVDLFRVDSSRAGPKYVAFVFDEHGYNALIDLGETTPIDSMIAGYRFRIDQISSSTGSARAKSLRFLKSQARALYDLLWRPLESAVGEARMVFIAPEGKLHLMPFTVLVDEEGKYVIERYKVHHLAAGRDILRLTDEHIRAAQRLLALGDPDFDAPAIKEEMDLSGTPILANGAAVPPQSLRSVFDAVRGLGVSRLPGTGTEVRAIASHDDRAVVLTGRKASEENFKRLAPQFGRIHLATHGFSLREAPMFGHTVSRPVENPLLQTGLYLAGANRRASAIDTTGTEDGVLTALEVAELDLRATGLVVLSACETGIGRVETGEGVYDMRRAFHAAGVRTVIGSLWKVPDEETATLFRQFYSGSGENCAERMQRAAVSRIREARKRGRPADPSAWGAFVATGEWRIPARPRP